MKDKSTTIKATTDNMSIYKEGSYVGFYKNKDEYGIFSNMYAMPITVAGKEYRTTEHLYQIMRFPQLPEFQALLATKASPMQLKWSANGKKKTDTHPDFVKFQIEIMEWIIRMKVSQNLRHFVPFFRKSKGKAICEASPRDQIWGAVLDKETNARIGLNHLGKIWMKIRDEYFENPSSLLATPRSKFSKTLTLDGKKIL